VTERGEGELIAQAGGADNRLHLPAHVGQVNVVRLRPRRPRQAVAPIATQPSCGQ
jgi:hypothetical protein